MRAGGSAAAHDAAARTEHGPADEEARAWALRKARSAVGYLEQAAQAADAAVEGAEAKAAKFAGLTEAARADLDQAERDVVRAYDDLAAARRRLADLEGAA